MSVSVVFIKHCETMRIFTYCLCVCDKKNVVDFLSHCLFSHLLSSAIYVCFEMNDVSGCILCNKYHLTAKLCIHSFLKSFRQRCISAVYAVMKSSRRLHASMSECGDCSVELVCSQFPWSFHLKIQTATG